MSATEDLANTTSLIEYPIKIWSTNKANFDITNWANGTSGLWRPGWNLILCYNRYVYFYRATAAYAGSPMCNFLDLTYDSTSGHYNIDTTYDISDVTLNLTTWSLFYGNYSSTDVSYSYRQNQAVFLDVSSWSTSESKASNTWNSINPVSNYAREICIDGLPKASMPMKLGSVMCWNYDGTWNYNKSTYPYDQINSSGSEWYINGIPEGFIDTYSTSITRTAKSLKNIYNNSTDSYVPVSFGGNIYLTNNNNARFLLCNNSKLSTEIWNGSGKGLSKYSSSYIYKYINSVLEPGYCLEPVGKGNTSRDKSKKCLWQPSDIYYAVTLPHSGAVVEHKMTDGILLTEIPSNAKVNCLTVELETPLFNDASLDASEEVYVVFSKNPIGDIDATTLGNCLDIYDSTLLNPATKVKNKKLEKNVNMIYIKDVEKNDKLYYKVYYSNAVTKPVIITKAPVVTLEKES